MAKIHDTIWRHNAITNNVAVVRHKYMSTLVQLVAWCRQAPLLTTGMTDISSATWASYHIRKIAGCACPGNAGNVFCINIFVCAIGNCANCMGSRVLFPFPKIIFPISNLNFQYILPRQYIHFFLNNIFALFCFSGMYCWVLQMIREYAGMNGMFVGSGFCKTTFYSNAFG